MEISTKQLRLRPGRIISQVNSGQEITVTYRGKPRAKIVPVMNGRYIDLEEAEVELFGIWKDREDLENPEQFIRKMRKGRKL